MDLRLRRASMEERHQRKKVVPAPPKPHRQLLAESTSAASSSSFFSDEFSEEEETNDNKRKTDSRRRSKRKRRLTADPEPLSSISDNSSDEDAAAVAMCLVMLSRDTWQNRRGSKEHRCEVCSKVFRSSQALGGHRVTHRNLNQLGKRRRKTVLAAVRDDDGDEKVFECPYCYKVFASGQALGGHKRSHNGGSVPSPAPKAAQISLIDLNLPAPEEEDESSVVSDAETTNQ